MATKTKRRRVCHSHFPYVKELRAKTLAQGQRPSLIKYNDRARGFCFTYGARPKPRTAAEVRADARRSDGW